MGVERGGSDGKEKGVGEGGGTVGGERRGGGAGDTCKTREVLMTSRSDYRIMQLITNVIKTPMSLQIIIIGTIFGYLYCFIIIIIIIIIDNIYIIIIIIIIIIIVIFIIFITFVVVVSVISIVNIISHLCLTHQSTSVTSRVLLLRVITSVAVIICFYLLILCVLLLCVTRCYYV